VSGRARNRRCLEILESPELPESPKIFELGPDSDTPWARLTGNTSYFISTSGLRVIPVHEKVIPVFRLFGKSRYRFELRPDSDIYHDVKTQRERCTMVCYRAINGLAALPLRSPGMTSLEISPHLGALARALAQNCVS